MVKYNQSNYYLGKLCKNNHKYEDSEKSLREKGSYKCLICKNLGIKEKGKKPYICFCVMCKNCNNFFSKPRIRISDYINNFCSHSCSAQWNNLNKKYGIRRSKLEIFIENEIKTRFPNFIIECNKKDVIGSELDFYFPQIKLAIEINGKFHYKPVFGIEKLRKIQSNDNNKITKCKNENIQLVIIDSSPMNRFNLLDAQVYTNSILNLIMIKIKINNIKIL